MKASRIVVKFIHYGGLLWRSEAAEEFALNCPPWVDYPLLYRLFHGLFETEFCDEKFDSRAIISCFTFGKIMVTVVLMKVN